MYSGKPHSAIINQIDARAVGNDVSRAFGVDMCV